MNTDKLWLEARQLLADWFVPVSVVLVVVAFVSGFAVYSAMATPPEPTEYDTVDRWSTTVDLTHSATVSEPNEVYSVGQQLIDQPRYYTDVMPVLRGEIQYSYQAPEGDVDVETEITQVTRAVDDTDDSVVYWRDEQPLGVDRASGLSPGETHTDAAEIDVNALDRTATETAESLGSTAGTLEAVVRIDVRMDGTIDGEPVEHAEQYELPITVTTGSYVVELPSETGHVEQQTEPPATGWADGLGDAIGMVVLFVLSLVSLGGLVVTKRRGQLAPSAVDRQAVDFESQRESLKEWISRGTVPSSVDDRPRIEVASLAELVDVAIDSNRRVIDREATDEYVVVDDNAVYGFRPENPEKTPTQSDDVQTKSDDSDTNRTDTATSIPKRRPHPIDGRPVDGES